MKLLPVLLEMKGEIQIAKGKHADAIETYRRLLTDFEGKRPLGSLRYKLGQLLFDAGDLKGAETTWNQLQKWAIIRFGTNWLVKKCKVPSGKMSTKSILIGFRPCRRNDLKTAFCSWMS